MTVIAMTREMGSRGRDVAAALAEELGLRIVQHELVDHVADRMHAKASSVNHFLEGTASFFERWGIDRDDLSLRTAEEILELASEGNVLFRGWGATHVLRPVPHALCVRVCAPLSSRTREIMSRTGISDPNVAEREVRKNDEAHSRVLSQLFNANWDDALGYDAVLSLGRMSVPTCVDVIKRMVASEAFAVTDESQLTLRRLITEAHIRAALHEHDVHRHAAPSFEVMLDPASGVVTLRGVVFEESFRAKAMSIVAGVEGVNEVRDEMFVPRTPNIAP